MSESEREDHEETLADASPLVRLLGRESRVRIITAFLQTHPEALTVSEIAEVAGVSRETVHRELDLLIDLGVIKKTRDQGTTSQYTLNANNEIAKLLSNLESELLVNQSLLSE